MSEEKPETINTNAYALREAAHYVVEADRFNKKIIQGSKGDVVIYEFTGFILDASVDVTDTGFKIGMFANAAGDLLRALGAKESQPGLFVRPSSEEVEGKQIEFDLIHKADNKGTMREMMINIVPFDSTKKPMADNAKKDEEATW